MSSGTREDTAAHRNRARRTRIALCLVCLLAAGAPLARYTQDLGLRHAAQRFAEAAELGRIRPESAQAMSLEPAGDLAIGIAVSEAIRRSSPAASPETLRRARDLMLGAVAARPGWAYHRYLLGLADAAGPGDRSRRTLRLAAQAAPGMDAMWSSLGRAELAAWPDLSPSARSEASDAFRRALRDEDFAASEFTAIATALGSPRAMALLPEESAILDAAAGSLAENGDVAGAAQLLARAEKADRVERDQGLSKLDRLRQLGDLEALRTGCRAWLDRHPFTRFDDAAGRKQLARLLALWPNDRFGSWSGDPRARLVRFFLDGRAAGMEPEILVRTVESLTGVPEAVRARVQLAAGNLAAAQDLARGAGLVASPDWDPYLLALSTRELSAGKIVEARATLARLSLAARDQCEALLLRRALARALGDGEELATAERRLAALREVSPEDWAPRGTLSICIDPEWSAGRRLDVTIGPGSPVILAYGWDGGRLQTLYFPSGGSVFSVALAGLSGRHDLWASFLVGSGGRSLHASIREVT